MLGPHFPTFVQSEHTTCAVLSEFRAHSNQAGKAAFHPSDRFLPFSAGRVLVDARAMGDGAALLDDLNQSGLLIGTRHADAVSGLLPVAMIDQAIALEGRRSISAAIAPNPTHTYAAGGTYTIELTVTDNDGGLDSSSQQVTVGAGGGNAPSVANFSYICNARDCSFDSSASTDDVGIISYS